MSDFESRFKLELGHLNEQKQQQATLDTVRIQRLVNTETESRRTDGTDPSLIVGEEDASLLTEYINFMKNRGMPRAKSIPIGGTTVRERPVSRGIFRSRPNVEHSNTIPIVKGYAIGRTGLKWNIWHYKSSNWPPLSTGATISSGVEIFELKDRFPDETGCRELYGQYDSHTILLCEDGRLRTDGGKNIYPIYDSSDKELLIFAPGGEIVTQSNNLEDGNYRTPYFAYVPLSILLPVIAARDLDEKSR
jgi:hypothetical protein